MVKRHNAIIKIIYRLSSMLGMIIAIEMYTHIVISQVEIKFPRVVAECIDS